MQMLFHHERKQGLQSRLSQSATCTSQSFEKECGQFAEHLTHEIFRIFFTCVFIILVKVDIFFL